LSRETSSLSFDSTEPEPDCFAIRSSVSYTLFRVRPSLKSVPWFRFARRSSAAVPRSPCLT